ncbi:ABC transporter substrate-binding protein [Treponema sp.]
MIRKLAFSVLATLAVIVVPAQTLLIYTEDAPPLSMPGPDGNPIGLAVEIVQEIQNRVGNTDTIELVPWARGMAILDKSPNILLFSMGRTAERNEKYQWIGPLYESAFALFSLADSKLSVKNIEDAKKATAIGVYRDDVRDQILTGLGLSNLKRVDDENMLARMLFAKRLDLIASSAVGVKAMLDATDHKESEVKLQYVFSQTQLYIGVSKATSPAVVKAWNEALETMKKDLTFRKLFEKYKLLDNIPGPAITKF